MAANSFRIPMLCAAFLVAGTTARGAFEPLPAGARCSALCGALLLSCHEPLSVAANPSLLSGIAGASAEFSLSPGRFGLQELRLLDAALAFPLGPGGGGCHARLFGGPLYGELTITGSIARPLSDRFDGGFSLSLYHLHIAGYGAASAWAVSAGARARVADPLLFAASVRNINRPLLGRAREPVGMEMLASLQYDPAAWLHLLVALSKEERALPAAAAGLEAELAGCIALRTGISEGSSEFGFGASLTFPAFALDYGLVSHASLGFTHALTLSIGWPQ
ncbi:MAG TPA: hypothetical protein VF889_01270 [Bacteroidota bacterium]